MQQEEIDEESQSRMIKDGLQMSSDSLMFEMARIEVLGRGNKLVSPSIL